MKEEIKDQSPPKAALRLLSWFCPEHLYEEIEGDLIQRFNRDLNPSDRLNRSDGYWKKRAKRRLIWNTIRFLRPGIILRNKISIDLNRYAMFRNYLITALRIFLRQKTYSSINVVGLSLSMASAIFIGLYLADEISYDRFLNDSDKIYRVGITEKFNGKEFNYISTSAPLADAMRTRIPEVVAAVRIGHAFNYAVRYEDKIFNEKRFFMADSNFFKFFTYDWIAGDRETCLRGPDKIAISESTAQKYFGDDGISNAMGKVLTLGEGKRSSIVTGIFRDVPGNTHLRFDLILSADSWEYAMKDDCWACYNLNTYFKINEVSSLPAVEAKLDEFARKEIIARIERDLKVSHEQFVKSGDRVSFYVQPLAGIHLNSHSGEEYEPGGDIRYVYLFAIIGVLIILIGCINFMNLATARATGRAKEVGIRKSIGAIKRWLTKQFLIESYAYVFISAVLALIAVALLMPSFNDFTGKQLSLNFLLQPYSLLVILLFIVVIGLIAGSYPAFVLTSFKITEVLKGKVSGNTGAGFRNTLVVFQFSVSMLLIIGTLTVYKQLQFIQQQNLGFEKENVIRIGRTEGLNEKSGAFKDQLLKHPEFITATYVDQLPPNITNTLFIKTIGSEQLLSSYYTSTDYDYLQTMKLGIRKGRFFSRDFKSDSSAVVINEACAKLLGFENEGGQVGFGDSRKWDVVGIVKDYNFESLHGSIKPLVLFLSEYPETMAVRMTPGDESAKVKLAESIWKEFTNGAPFQYSFIDDNFNALFRSEQQMGKLFWVFTAMAIFVSSLGLLGLITFITGQRKKEIGIRKVMGASAAQIVWLLSGKLIKLVVVSFVIAVPLAWYGIERWLETFAYRTSFDFSLTIVAGVSGLLIAMLTVAYQSISAANVNPVESLKNE